MLSKNGSHFQYFNLLFIWKKIAIQYCVGFCHTTKQISHNYTYIASLFSLLSPSPTPLGHHRVPGWVPCVIEQLLTSCLFYTWQYIFVEATFSVHPTLFFSHCVHKSIFYVHVSILSLLIGSSIPFF